MDAKDASLPPQAARHSELSRTTVVSALSWQNLGCYRDQKWSKVSSWDCAILCIVDSRGPLAGGWREQTRGTA